MDSRHSRCKSAEVSLTTTTDEGNDKQEIYKTTTIQSINNIIHQSSQKINEPSSNSSSRQSLKFIQIYSTALLQKYNCNKENWFIKPIINKKAKKWFINQYKEILICHISKIKTNIKKYSKF